MRAAVPNGHANRNRWLATLTRRRRGTIVQVRVGVQLVPKELVVETKLTADEVQQELNDALESAAGLFVLKDTRGGRIVIPAKHVGYLEIGEDENRQVGFGTL
jgi:hypothetical protein